MNSLAKSLCICLWKVTKEQQRYVASNLSSVASCYVLTTNGSCPMPYAIYADEQMVGFVMIIYGNTGINHIAKDNYCILRLMIGEQYQNHGYGHEAMVKILNCILTFPVSTAKYCLYHMSQIM